MDAFGVFYLYYNHSIMYTTWLFAMCRVNLNDYILPQAILE